MATSRVTWLASLGSSTVLGRSRFSSTRVVDQGRASRRNHQVLPAGARPTARHRRCALRRGIQALKPRLQALPERSELPKGAQYKDLDGYRTREAAYRCIIKREAFNAIFPNTSNRALVLDWLLQKRIITTAESRKAGPGSSPKPKEQFDWPDGKRRRSYEIRLPRVRAKSGKRVKATSKKESEQ